MSHNVGVFFWFFFDEAAQDFPCFLFSSKEKQNGTNHSVLSPAEMREPSWKWFSWGSKYLETDAELASKNDQNKGLWQIYEG